jgi:ribosome assembly protein YihI (activator of Der GTPase)
MVFSGVSEEIKTWDIKKIAYGAFLQKTNQYFSENSVAAKEGGKRTWKEGMGEGKEKKRRKKREKFVSGIRFSMWLNTVSRRSA